MEKDEKFYVLLNNVVELDIKKGHLKWTISELSRKSSVTRSLIYYYFGKKKIDILMESMHFFGKSMAGVTKEKMELYSQNEFIEGLKSTRALIEKCPYILTFYFVNRDKLNPVGEIIRYYEMEGLKKRREFFPKLSDKEVRTLYSLQFGLSTCPNLEDEDLELPNSLISRFL